MVHNWDPTEVRSKEHLNLEVMRTWELLRLGDSCLKMVNSMKSHLKQVLDSGGYNLRY